MDVRDYFEHTWAARERLLDAFEELTREEWTREFDFSWKSVRNLFAHWAIWQSLRARLTLVHDWNRNFPTIKRS